MLPLGSNEPNIITQKISIGTTLEGRNIWAVKISDNPNVEENEPEGKRSISEELQIDLWLKWADELNVFFGIDNESQKKHGYHHLEKKYLPLGTGISKTNPG